MNTRSRILRIVVSLSVVALSLYVSMLAGCDAGRGVTGAGGDGDKAAHHTYQIGDAPPATQATVSLGASSLTFWPYTGRAFVDQPVDPINLVFAGEVSPLQIRAALLALSGDRSAYGFPPVPPFNQPWTDAIGGDVQTTWSQEGDGWVGSIIQLVVGGYGPIRFHLRLFQTDAPCGEGTWTLGGAHFEVQIPGVADHESLDWELAEDFVMVDMMRTGLLDPGLPVIPTGPINASPTYRVIRAPIYNGLPADLVALIGGPPQPVTEDVPIDSDGQGVILNVVSAASVPPGEWVSTHTVQYGQLVPRPYCSDGNADYLYLTGPVSFVLSTSVSPSGEYFGLGSYSGTLEVIPMDMSGGQPVPAGEPFKARVHGWQDGRLGAAGGAIFTIDAKVTGELAGPQLLSEERRIAQVGEKVYRAYERCIDPGELMTGN
jgi:hypothetical protein